MTTLIPTAQAAQLPAPDSSSPDEWTALAEALAAAEFTNARIAELLGEEAVAALDREQIVPGQVSVLRHLPDGPPDAGCTPAQRCAVLTGLFLLSVEVTIEQVDGAVPSLGVDGLRRIGVVFTDGHAVRPAADLRPYSIDTSSGTRDLWVLSDLSAHQIDGALPDEHVLGVGRASLTLAGLVHRRPVARALDLGTGCGIQLFHLLDHAAHVIGTDISARALDFARCNLLLNSAALGLDPHRLEDRVQLRRGSLFAPVAEEQFDLVVSNPPFVITPRTGDRRYTYRDGGRAGDELMAELIEGLPAVLAPGGVAQMLGNWEVGEEGDWTARPRQWIEDAQLEAWIIQRELQGPAEYAETWLRDAAGERDLRDHRRRFTAYLEDFASREVSGIGFGFLRLARPADSTTASGGHRFEELTQPLAQPLGPTIGATCERALAVAEDAESVLAVPLAVAEDVTEERHQRFGAGDPEVILARQGAGLRRVRRVSSAAAGLLGAADGEFAAAQLITAVTTLLDDGATDLEALTQSLRTEVLQLYVDGFLTDVPTPTQTPAPTPAPPTP